MKKYLIAIFFLVSICRLLPQSVNERMGDIEFIKSRLPELHYDLFNKISEKEFIENLDKLKSGIDTLTDLEIILSLQQVINKIGDSHTYLNMSNYIDKENIYPLKLYWFEDGFYVIATHGKYKNILGWRLYSINGISIEEVMRRFETIIVKDNEAIIKQKLPKLIIVKDILDFLKITNDNGNTFVFSLGNDFRRIVLQTNSELPDENNTEKLLPGEMPLSLRGQNKLFWLKYLNDLNIIYVQYNSCWSREVEERFGSSQRALLLPSFEEFSDSLITLIKTIHPEKLIFDIRFNTGGSSKQGTDLINKLSEIDEINKKGKLFVIIGRNTFSSAIINAMNFKQETKALLIGEETSGSPNHYGEVKNITLPHLNIDLNYSTKYFKYSNSDVKTIQPDVRIEMSIEDFIYGRDPILEFIYNYGD